MSNFHDDLALVPEQFSGRARIFPLPNLVLFPHVIQPLHIFEPRFVEMFHDAIKDDRLIAMSLLEPGWESDYEGRPPIADVACLGRVVTWQAQENGRYNLLLLGLERVRVTRELPPARSFREADVELLPDAYPHSGSELRPTLHHKLADSFERLLPRIKDAEELFEQLSIDNISLGTLTDVIAYALDLDLRLKQSLLAEPSVDRRATMLLSQLHAASRETRSLSLAGFPPAFSTN
ncbi:MAG: ATP-dependent protease [Planctomycetota bacterium]|nr:MAG: ATP-dependent protease [Planctomycetota bacterium]